MARASALQAEGQGFKSPNLHKGSRKRVRVGGGVFDREEGRERRHGPRVPARHAWHRGACGAASGRAGRKDNMVKRDIGLWRMPVEP